jgi:hypothetical protein
VRKALEEAHTRGKAKPGGKLRLGVSTRLQHGLARTDEDAPRPRKGKVRGKLAKGKGKRR